MFVKTISSVVLASVLLVSPLALAKDKPKAMIAPGLFSFEVMHDGAMVEIKRNQNPENLITDLYATTFRGMPQAMHPFEPYDVETIAEREFVQLMIAAQSDKNIMIVDTRTIGWHQRLTIPGAVSYPYTMMNDAEDRDWAMDDFGAVKQSDGSYDFEKARARCNLSRHHTHF